MIAWFTSLFRRWSSPSGVAASHSSQRQDLDPELCEVFFAELDDVTQTLVRAMAAWRANPADEVALKSLKRGFHTLKGSAPLIGATQLGEFAALLERLVVRQIERPQAPTPDLFSTVEQAIAVLPPFAQSVRDARPQPPMVRALGHKVQRFLA